MNVCVYYINFNSIGHLQNLKFTKLTVEKTKREHSIHFLFMLYLFFHKNNWQVSNFLIYL
jgi:hypothetical protein